MMGLVLNLDPEVVTVVIEVAHVKYILEKVWVVLGPHVYALVEIPSHANRVCGVRDAHVQTPRGSLMGAT